MLCCCYFDFEQNACLSSMDHSVVAVGAVISKLLIETDRDSLLQL